MAERRFGVFRGGLEGECPPRNILFRSRRATLSPSWSEKMKGLGEARPPQTPPRICSVGDETWGRHARGRALLLGRDRVKCLLGLALEAVGQRRPLLLGGGGVDGD